MARRGGTNRPPFRILPTLLLTAAILGVPTAVFAWGRQSSSFTIEKVAVSGTDLVAKRQALRLLRAEHEGSNLFTVTRADVRTTLDSLCYVKDVSVDRDFPHTLRVRIHEHQPALYVLARGRWYVVADDGHVICAAGSPAAGAGEASGGGESTAAPSPSAAAAGEEAAGSDGANAGTEAAPDTPPPPDLEALRAGPPKAELRLPRLAAAGPVKVGRTLGEPEVGEALRVVATLPQNLRRRLAMVRVTGRRQVTLWFTDGPRVVWGDEDRSRAKMLALQAVLAHYRRAGKAPTFLDVSTPDRVLARPVLK